MPYEVVPGAPPDGADIMTSVADLPPMGPGDLAELVYRMGLASWDLGEPQAAIRQLVALGAVKGEVLDPGCGPGWHSIEYARAGCKVTGVDLAPTAIERARRNVRAAGVAADFTVGDVTKLRCEGIFDTVVDSKLYDNLESTEDRERYAAALHRAMRPGGKLFMFGFGPGSVNGVHNHLLDDPDFETVLPAAGFEITFVGSTTFELVNRDYKGMCPNCPAHVPDGRLHIPMTEVHAVRR